MARGVAADGEDLRQQNSELEARLELAQSVIKRLTENEFRQNELFSLMNDAVFVQQHGKIVFANAAAVKLHGFDSPDQLIGVDITELIHPDDRDLALSRRQELMNGATLAPIERQGLHRDGTGFMCEVRGSRIIWEDEPAALVVLRDITERKQAEQEATEQSALLNTTLEIMGHGYCVFDAESRLAGFNQKYIDAYQYPPGFIRLGMHHEEILRMLAQKGILGDGDVEELVRVRLESVHAAEESTNENVTPDGSAYLYQRRRIPSGGFVATFTDITERREAEIALRESEERFRAVVDNSPTKIHIKDADGRYILVNRQAEQLFGVTDESARGKTTHEIFANAQADVFVTHDQAVLQSGETVEREEEWLKEDGVHTFLTVKFPIRNDSGKVVSVGAIGTDITERKRAEEALRESEKRYRGLIENSGLGIHISKAKGGRLFINDALIRLLGYESLEEIDKVPNFRVIAPHEMERSAQYRMAANENSGDPLQYECDFVQKDGSIIPLHVIISKIVWDGEEAVQRTVIDLSERRKAEQAQRESEDRYRQLAEMSPEGIMVNTDGKITFANVGMAKIFGAESPEQLIGKFVFDLAAPEEHKRILELQKTVDANEVSPLEEIKFLRLDGSVTFLERVGTPVTWDDKPSYLVIFRDVNARRRAQNELAEQKSFFETLVANIPASVTIKDREGKYLFVNALICAASNKTFDEIVGSTAEEAFGIDPDDTFVEYTKKAIATGEPIFGIEKKSEFVDDKFVSSSFVPIKGTDGKVDRLLTISFDITESRQREEQLRQAQKMEAVGQLTGGVAHDFNNLLTVVLGNLHLLTDRIADDEIARGYVDSAISGAERGAKLTHRLLAFSRKQALFPVIIEPRELMEGMLDLLRSSLGETIEIEVSGDANLWHCEADPAQLESALLNLAINARDAMPDGGKLTIETRNASVDDEYAIAQIEMKPGEYVVVSVTDTGTGIPAEAIDHVFEPFFTTKEVGKGSGLGLSMVYGFAKQSGGNVTIYSEDGVGTTVKIYLPKSAAIADAASLEKNETEPRARGETILVVEDDPDVRTLAVALLSDLGYETLEAADGVAALAALDANPRVNLLFTDIVMPGGMNGPALAEEARRRCPGISILFTSGYTDDAILHQGDLDKGFELLNKPFGKSDLARKVRSVLDNTPL